MRSNRKILVKVVAALVLCGGSGLTTGCVPGLELAAALGPLVAHAGVGVGGVGSVPTWGGSRREGGTAQETHETPRRDDGGGVATDLGGLETPPWSPDDFRIGGGRMSPSELEGGLAQARREREDEERRRQDEKLAAMLDPYGKWKSGGEGCVCPPASESAPSADSIRLDSTSVFGTGN